MAKIFGFLCLALLLASFVPSSQAYVDAEELAALRAIAVAFPTLVTNPTTTRRWTDARLQTACNSGVTLQGISCFVIDGVPRVYSLTIASGYPFVSSIDLEVLKGLQHLRILDVTLGTTSTVQRIDDFLVLSNLRSIGLSISLSTSTFGHFDAPFGNVPGLKQLTLYGGYGFGSWPDLSNNSLEILTITALASLSGIEMPVDLLWQQTELTSLTMNSHASYPFNVMPDIGNCTKLKSIDLSRSNLSLPLDVVLPDLETLTVISTYIRKLPPTLSQSTKLKSISARSSLLNQLDSIPDLSNTRVSSIDLQFNGITEIPTGLCHLTTNPFDATNITLQLGSNPIETIPACFSNSEYLAILYLGSTNMTTFPEPVMQLPGLTRLDWSYNLRPMVANAVEFTSEILSYVSLRMNQITGNFPTALNHPKLTHFESTQNDWIGTLSDDYFANKPAFRQFIVTGARLSGPFPSSINTSNVFQKVDVTSNRFTSIPDSITFSQSAQSISFGDNRLTSIPADALWQNSRASFVNLGGNPDLSGSIPTWWSKSNYLQVINMTGTGFGGPLPNFNSTALSQAHLSNMNLNGNIPAFTRASSLVQLDLSRNSLAGAIPNSIGAATTGARSLDVLDLSFNMLSGSLPTSFGDLTNLNVLRLNNNGFSGLLVNFATFGQIVEIQLQNNQFSLCAFNPLIPSRVSSKCNVTNNKYPNACECASYYTYCEHQAECPPPDWVAPPESTTAPSMVPTPVKEPTSEPEPEGNPSLAPSPNSISPAEEDAGAPTGTSSTLSPSHMLVILISAIAITAVVPL